MKIRGGGASPGSWVNASSTSWQPNAQPPPFTFTFTITDTDTDTDTDTVTWSRAARRSLTRFRWSVARSR